MLNNIILYILCSLSIASCGYRIGEDGVAAKYKSISVPIVKGDWNGDLTSVLVEKISKSGCYQYHRDGAELILKVEIIDFDDQNIGFRYDRHKDGKIRNSIIPTETRLTAMAEVSLIEACSGNAIIGPVRLTAAIDFDHDSYKSRNGINIFSLGQLNDYDEAYEAAYHPLNQTLAQKIVDLICDSW